MQRRIGRKGSFEVRDETSHARHIAWRCFPAESGLDGIVKLVCRGGGTGASEIHVQVIDAAVIEQPVIGVEDGRFRRNPDLSLSDERVLRIAQRREFVAVVAFMLANFFSGSHPAGIDEPEGYSSSILRADSLNQRRIAVGDRAISAHEDEHNRFSRGCQKGICWGAVEMQAVFWAVGEEGNARRRSAATTRDKKIDNSCCEVRLGRCMSVSPGGPDGKNFTPGQSALSICQAVCRAVPHTRRAQKTGSL